MKKTQQYFIFNEFYTFPIERNIPQRHIHLYIFDKIHLTPEIHLKPIFLLQFTVNILY